MTNDDWVRAQLKRRADYLVRMQQRLADDAAARQLPGEILGLCREMKTALAAADLGYEQRLDAVGLLITVTKARIILQDATAVRDAGHSSGLKDSPSKYARDADRALATIVKG